MGKLKGKHILFGFALLLAALAIYSTPKLIRLYNVVVLFEEGNIVHNFRNMKDLFHYNTIHAGKSVHSFDREIESLPESFTYDNKLINTKDFLTKSWTTGLIVIQHNTILHESYYLGNTESSHNISWSVGKSFVSALVGIAVDEGLIKSIHDPVTLYVPALKGSAYDGIPIKHILNMSTGVRFNEDYGDFDSDINRMGRTLALDTSMEDFILSLERERPSGEFRHYVSMDTQVLGMLLKSATGETLSHYLEEKMWKPAGMEHDAYWLLDGTGMELAFGTLNVTLRDFARFGCIYRDGGKVDGKQIVPANWVKASVTPDEPHLMPGQNANSDSLFGYGYQWWIPPGNESDFMAIGIYNQFIYVNPKRNLVIAKTSAYASYTDDQDSSEHRTTALFREIAKTMGR